MSRRPADVLISLGFWMQLVLLAFVDWGTLLAFRTEKPPWYHVVGFVVVNAALVGIWLWAWVLRRRAMPRRAASGSGP